MNMEKEFNKTVDSQHPSENKGAIFILDNMVKIPYITHIDNTSEEIYE